MTSLRIFQILLVVFIVTIVGSTSYAFAAGNTVLQATAGDSANDVSGYEITNIAYAVNNADPTQLNSVSFSLDASARTVKVKLSKAGSTWYDCSASGGNLWTCDTPGVGVASIDQLRVSATSN